VVKERKQLIFSEAREKGSGRSGGTATRPSIREKKTGAWGDGQKEGALISPGTRWGEDPVIKGGMGESKVYSVAKK